MKHLIIIGARGFGREVYCSACESIGYGEEFDIKGYLDDKADALDGYNEYPPILGAVETYEIEPDDVFICALGEVKWKKHYSQLILDKGGEFITLIHKTAYVGKNSQVGKGCILLAGCRVHCDVKVGNYVTIQPYAILGHDVTVGNWCHINAYADCGGFSEMCEGATLHTTSFILPKSKVGKYATVGAGSVVLRKVPDGMSVFGVPAKPVLTPKVR